MSAILRRKRTIVSDTELRLSFSEAEAALDKSTEDLRISSAKFAKEIRIYKETHPHGAS